MNSLSSSSMNRLRLGLVILSAAALLATSLTVVLLNERRLRIAIVSAANMQAQILADTVAAPLAFDDHAALRESVDALKASQEIEAVGVYDEHGVLVAGYVRSPSARRLPKIFTLTDAPGQVVVSAPVQEHGVRLGSIYLRDRSEPGWRRFNRYIGPGLLVAMASLMFAIMAFNARVLSKANRDLTIQMAEREKAEAALRQSQKMEAIGRLTGGIAHDFNNMLAVVLGSLDLLVRKHPIDGDPRTLRLANQAIEGAKRAAALTQRLLAFSRLQPLKPKPADIGRTVREMTDLLRSTLGETIAIETISAGGLWPAYIDLPQLETAILNLAINARDAMPDGGKLTIETANAYLDRSYVAAEQEVSAGQYVLVAITDTGTGMSSEVLAQVFEPFFTTKAVGMGTGLGLSQVHGFIKQSGGHVRIYSEVGAGTTVKLYLPRSTAEVERSTSTPAKSTARKRRELTVLVAEDEDGVRDFAVEALAELGYDVVAASGAKMALDLLEAHPEVALLLTDVVMPDMNGRVLSDEAQHRKPSLRTIFMTGYTRNAIVHNGVLDAGAHLLSKPFTVAELEAELDAVLARRGANPPKNPTA